MGCLMYAGIELFKPLATLDTRSIELYSSIPHIKILIYHNTMFHLPTLENIQDN